MDLNDTLPEQLTDLKEWLQEIADMGTPSSLVWGEMSLGMRERALFLDSYVIPKVVPVTTHLGKGTVKETPFELDQALPDVPPVPAEGNGFMRRPGAT